MRALCLGAGNIATQYAEWCPCEHWELHNTSVCHHMCLYICDFSMDVKLEQRANIIFCMKLGKSGAETFEMI
jgi:hypothetical protein